jgi:hypothetical protein
MINRWDETWHRLLEWTNGQGLSERLAAQILYAEGYKDIDPSHPLGGKDDGKDAICSKEGQRWLMAVHFPRGRKEFNEVQSKFLEDLKKAKKQPIAGIAFVTNQELRLGERKKLVDEAGLPLDIFHLERLTAILDRLDMSTTRMQFLSIEDVKLSAGGKGGNAKVIGKNSGAIGGNAGKSGLGPGGDGGSA